MTRILRRAKSWRLWAVAAIVVVTGVGGYYGFTVWTASSPDEDAIQTQLVPVTRGDLVNDVTITGTLIYTTRETITFGQPGFVSGVAVSEGDSVRAGDVLAVLDAETVANLEKAIAQARVDVRNAEDALEEARSPYTAAMIAEAESDVANARLDLQKAEEELSELGVVPPDLLVQAQIDILNARADLETAMEDRDALVTPKFQAIAKAQSDVTAARIALHDAKDALEAFLKPTDGDVAAAEADVTKARLDLEAARNDLSALTSVTALDLAKARAAVADAQLDLEAAQVEVDEATSPTAAVDISDYQAEIDSAKSDLTGAQFDLWSVELDASDKVTISQDELMAAQDHYAGVFTKWLGMDVASRIDSPPEAILASHDTDLDSIFRGASIDEAQSSFEQGTLHDDPATPWNEIVVFSWAVLYLGDVLVDCDNIEANISGACLADEFADAWSAVEEKAANRDVTAAQQAEKVREAKVAVSKAEDAVELREKDLSDYLVQLSEDALTESEIRSKVEALGLAKANLTALKEELADLTTDPDPLDIESKKREIATAEIKLADSLEALASLIGEPDELMLESKGRAVDTAEAELLDAETALADLMKAADLDLDLAHREIELTQAKLDDAEEALGALLQDPDPLDVLAKQAEVRLAVETLAESEATLEEYNAVDQLEIDLRQADLVAARATLDTAVADLDRASLRAPFDGIVTAVDIEGGQQVNANTQAVEVADPSVVEVSGSVDEIDVLFLQVGARASVSLEALGTQPLLGAVSSIANSGDSQQGIVTYPVTIRVDSSENVQLPEGLSATAQVIIREQTDSILIPLQALYGSVQAPTVKVVSGNDIIERQVALGISDDFWVVVEQGLDEGETISMEVVGSSTSQFGGFGATFRAVGGFGGPRPRGGQGGGGR